MYILACHKCGEIKVVSSIANERGLTEACWTCPRCGAGQLMEIDNSACSRKSDLQKIIKGIGFAATGKRVGSKAGKSLWPED